MYIYIYIYICIYMCVCLYSIFSKLDCIDNLFICFYHVYNSMFVFNYDIFHLCYATFQIYYIFKCIHKQSVTITLYTHFTTHPVYTGTKYKYICTYGSHHRARENFLSSSMGLTSSDSLVMNH